MTAFGSVLVALDFDGTLALITPHPEDARPWPGVHRVLRDVRATGAALAVVTGRSVSSLLRVSGFGAIPGIVIYGTHGAERWQEGSLHAAAAPPGLEELRERLRARAREKAPEHLHRILRRLDRNAAGKIHANDLPKLIRAIEVCISARRPITEQWRAGNEPLRGFRILRIGLDPERSQLYERINERVQKMFAAGLVEETSELRKKYGEAARPLASIGYKQVVQLLDGELDREAAIRAVQQAHRNYAKRQMTWFRREPEVIWFTDFGDRAEVIAQAISLVGESVRASR